MPLTCEKCGETKRNKAFRQEKRSPTVWSKWCLACLHEKEDQLRQEEVRERKKFHEKNRRKEFIKKYTERNRKIKAAHKDNMSERIVAELAERELARRKLIHFIQKFHPLYQAGWVHQDICRRLEQFVQDVADKKSPRLMLCMPPRHGKSLIASQFFPAWTLGHHPEFELIAASYAVTLPLGFSRKVRSLVRDDPQYHALFPGTQINPESQSAETWRTLSEGGYVAAGVGSGIAGKGAHILIIDDPIKDAEEADSETTRESIWDWYGSAAYTRLAPGGGVLVIQTRWHDADLAGKLLQKEKEDLQELEEAGMPTDSVDRWELIQYPAIATGDEYLWHDPGTGHDRILCDLTSEELLFKGFPKRLRSKGDALHPDRFPRVLLDKIQRTVQPRHWSALYQQNPVPEEGAYFTKDMIRYYNHEIGEFQRKDMHVYCTWDLAIGQKQQNDYTVGIVAAVDYDDNIYVLDMIRGRMNTYDIVESIISLHSRYDAQVTGIELGQLEMAIRPVLKKRMKERRIFVNFDDTLRPITDKSVRARPLQGRMQQGMIFLPANQPWVDTLTHELLRFPTGAHDDIVDALAWLVRMIAGKAPPKPPKKKKLKSWKDKLKVGGRVADPMGA